MRPQYHIPDWIEDRIIELSVGWLNRLQYKEQTKENYEAITFTLDEHREPNICHAFIALKGANKAWHRAVQRFMGQWHIIQYKRDVKDEIELIQFAPRTFRLAGVADDTRISTRREWAQDRKRLVFEAYITVSPEELTKHKELWRESGPNTWFCEWEQCVKIISKDWKDSEKNSKYLNINPHDPDMWSYTKGQNRRAFIVWKDLNRSRKAAYNEREGKLNEDLREQEQRMRKQEKPDK